MSTATPPPSSPEGAESPGTGPAESRPSGPEPLSRVTAATVDVLRVLATYREAVWGLLVVKQTGRPPGSVYPILERLESSRWITSVWEDDPGRSGPRRRLYELTDDGALAATSVVADFDARAAATRRAPAAPARGTRPAGASA